MINLFEWGLGEGVVRRSQTSDPQRFHQLSLCPPPPHSVTLLPVNPAPWGVIIVNSPGRLSALGVPINNCCDYEIKKKLWQYTSKLHMHHKNDTGHLLICRVYFFICPQSKLIIKWTSAILSSRESHIKVRIWRNICKLWNSPMIYKFFHRRLLNRSRALFDPKYPIKSVNIRTQ